MSMSAWMFQCTWKSEDNLRDSVYSFHHGRVLQIELRLSDLAPSIPRHLSVLTAHVSCFLLQYRQTKEVGYGTPTLGNNTFTNKVIKSFYFVPFILPLAESHPPFDVK